MFRQHHDGFVVDQPLVSGRLQVGRELQVQAFQALVVGREQLRLDAQQVAAIGGLALVDGQGDAQVRQVMRHGALLGPDQIGGDGGNQGQGDGKSEKFTHGEQTTDRVQGSPTRVGPMAAACQGALCIWINNLSVSVIER